MPNFSLRSAGKLAPPGNHVCKLESIEEAPGSFGKPVWRFIFLVIDGDHQDDELVKVTGASLRPNNNLGEFAAQLLGREVRRHEQVDFAQFLGQRFRVTAVPYPNGGEGAEIVKIEPLAA